MNTPPTTFIKYKITIWYKNKEVCGFRYLPEGKITAIKFIRPIIETHPKFYDVLGYKVETEKDLGFMIPDSKCKHVTIK